MIQLRPYQREAIDKLYAWWDDGGGNALIDLATGTGKSLVIAALCKELLATWPGLRIGIIAHVRELLSQNAQELLRLWPQAPIGVYSAGLNRREARAQILFAGIQSVWKKVDATGGFDLLLIDEAHLIPRASDTMYGRFIEACREKVPDMRVVGLTATPYRLDSGRLDQGEGALFEKVIYSYGIGEGVRDDYLAPLVNKATSARIDTEGVKVRGGEFLAESLQSAVMDSGVTPAAVAEMVHKGHDRRAWLVFCTGVAHAEMVRDEVRRHGVTCEMVSGETPSAERDRIIAAYRDGRIRCLANVNVLVTGFNGPHVDLLAWLRPTMSTGLYVQGCGRGTRKAPGKQNCLVLDYAGNIKRHGPVDMIELCGGKSAGDGEAQAAPTKECPNCESYVLLAATVCQDCGYAFPPRDEPKHEAKADESIPVMAAAAPEWLQVQGLSFRVHNADREDKLPSLQVDYLCGMVWHKEWVCFDHEGFPRRKAEQWWERLGGDEPYPASVEEAYQRRWEIKQPTSILIRPDGKFWRILAHRGAHHEVPAL